MKRTGYKYVEKMLEWLETEQEKLNYIESGLGKEICDAAERVIKQGCERKTVIINNQEFKLYSVEGCASFWGSNIVDLTIIMIEINFKNKRRQKILDDFFESERTDAYHNWFSTAKDRPIRRYSKRVSFQEAYDGFDFDMNTLKIIK